MRLFCFNTLDLILRRPRSDRLERLGLQYRFVIPGTSGFIPRDAQRAFAPSAADENSVAALQRNGEGRYAGMRSALGAILIGRYG